MRTMRFSYASLLLTCLSWVEALRPLPYDAQIDNGKQGSYPLLPNFATSEVRAPRINFETWSPECDDGRYYFVTPRGWKVNKPGPMILDAAGNLIWSKHFDNEFGGQAYDFKVQSYRGEQVLTFWLGDDTVRGHGKGHYYVLNSSYDVVQKIGAANGLFADLHDFVITPNDTALITIFSPKSADVRPFGRKFNDGWNQAAWDGILQEIDLETGSALFEWRASEHVSMNSTYHKLDSSVGEAGTRTKPFDWFHVNSVQKDDLGNFLISARNVHAIYYIDGKTGRLIWTLGGKNNCFHDLSDGQALRFAWQHDARFVPIESFSRIYTPPASHAGQVTRLMTVFDNAAMDFDHTYGAPHSRVLLLEVTYPIEPIQHNTPEDNAERSSRTSLRRDISEQDNAKVQSIDEKDSALTVRVIGKYIHPRYIRSGTQGSAQVLYSDGDQDAKVFAGYGINAVMTTFDMNGTILCDAHFGAIPSWNNGNVQSYRAFRYPWVGNPRSIPAATIRWGQAYISWNGATRVKTWLVQSSDDGHSDWQDGSQLPKEGFETSILLQDLNVSKSAAFYRFVAQDSTGNVCKYGISNVVRRSYINSFTRPGVRVTRNGSSFTYALFVLLGGGAVFWITFKLRHNIRSRTSRSYIPLTGHDRSD